MEDWYQTHDFNFAVDRWDSFEDRVEHSTHTLLELFSRHHVRATFFVLGCVAQKHPRLVREIAGAGHEIGSHGSWHRMVSKQTREDFRKDLLFSKYVLEDLLGKKVELYRASSWSISEDSLWALLVLEEEGFLCDSSIQPFRTVLSGISGAPVVPFHPVIEGRKLNLVEFTPTVLQLWKCRFPFAGGLYLRVLPRWFITWALARVNKKHSGVVYVHPWETDMEQPRLQVSPVVKMAHYLNLSTTQGKLEELLKNFNFVPLGELIRNNHYPSFRLD